MAVLRDGEAVCAGVVAALERLRLCGAEKVRILLVVGLGKERNGLVFEGGERDAVDAAHADAVLAVEVEVGVREEHVALVEADGVGELDVVHDRLDTHGFSLLVQHDAHHAAGVVLGVKVLVVAVVDVAVVGAVFDAHGASEPGLG